MKRLLLFFISSVSCMLPFSFGNSAGQMFGQNIIDGIKQQTMLSGYIIGQASANDQRDADVQTDMQLRMVRLSASGRVLDFGYQLQMQVNGENNDTKGNAPRIVDAWAEWQKWDFLRIKFGQFKRCFTFENPLHPWSTGPGSYSQLTNRLAGMNDRVGEHASGGRDFGLQLQGDLLPIAADRHPLFHYQIGLFNGQGINRADNDSRKDIIGGLVLRPMSKLQIGLFGWDGNFVKDGLNVDRTRWAVGAQYEGTVTARAEYAHSTGRKILTADDGTIYIGGADRADSWYALLGVPICDKVKLWGKYDVYRDTKKWSSARTLYILAADWTLHRNLKLQLNYTRVHDRTLNARGADGDYNTADIQLYVRF